MTHNDNEKKNHDTNHNAGFAPQTIDLFACVPRPCASFPVIDPAFGPSLPRNAGRQWRALVADLPGIGLDHGWGRARAARRARTVAHSRGKILARAHIRRSISLIVITTRVVSRT